VIDLYWLPLGAGGRFVAFNGRVYEWIRATREHRPSRALYHTALVVTVPEGRFVIENAWPIPDRDPASRGVVVEGPVWDRRLGRFRAFRYEVRRWRDGTIADAHAAVASPQRVSDDERQARQVLEITTSIPVFVWGRDQLGLGEMWNSNSVIAWTLARSGIAAGDIEPPDGGRVPGWTTGVLAASLETHHDPRAPRRGVRTTG